MKHIKDYRLANLKDFRVICDFTRLTAMDGAHTIRVAREMLADQIDGDYHTVLPSSNQRVTVTLEHDTCIPVVKQF